LKKIFLSLLVSFLFCFPTFADEISKFVKKTAFGVGSDIGIYIIDKTYDKVIYDKNIYDEFNPASILKVVSFAAAYDILGSEYEFKTSLYKDDLNNFYVKLGGDVLLNQDDLVSLISNLKNQKINKIYIDDSIFDNEKYPKTWLEEDKWPSQRAITPYIIDNNMVKISLHRSSLAKNVDIIQHDKYQISIINELKVADNHKFEILRQYGEELPIVNLQGTIAKDVDITLPVLNPEINFNVKLNYALEKNNIVYLNKINVKKAPQDAIEIAYVGHKIDEISKLILHNSNNFATEVVAKVAAAKYINYQKEATFDDAINMVNSIFSPYYSIKDNIVDVSGVSRKNLLCPKTIGNILSKVLEDGNFSKLLATSNQGTLAQRLLFLKGNLKGKTGTLRNYSSLFVNFETRNKTDIVLISIVQNSSKRKALLKDFENRLVSLIYKKY